MAVKPILTIPNQVLLTKSEKVKAIDSEIKAIAKDLLDTVKLAKNPEGAGIAANQIGVTKRIVVVRNFFPDPTNPRKLISEDYVLINPKIISTSKETEIDWEGCLSVPNIYGKVERYRKVKMTALDLNGNEIRLRASDYFAAVIQHEIDHLDGILFTSRMIGKAIPESELDLQ
jgi:peptide deformylase